MKVSLHLLQICMDMLCLFFRWPLKESCLTTRQHSGQAMPSPLFSLQVNIFLGVCECVLVLLLLETDTSDIPGVTLLPDPDNIFGTDLIWDFPETNFTWNRLLSGLTETGPVLFVAGLDCFVEDFLATFERISLLGFLGVVDFTATFFFTSFELWSVGVVDFLATDFLAAVIDFLSTLGREFDSRAKLISLFKRLWGDLVISALGCVWPISLPSYGVSMSISSSSLLSTCGEWAEVVATGVSPCRTPGATLLLICPGLCKSDCHGTSATAVFSLCNGRVCAVALPECVLSSSSSSAPSMSRYTSNSVTSGNSNFTKSSMVTVPKTTTKTVYYSKHTALQSVTECQ